jgi:hypothetical protein
MCTHEVTIRAECMCRPTILTLSLAFGSLLREGGKQFVLLLWGDGGALGVVADHQFNYFGVINKIKYGLSYRSQ